MNLRSLFGILRAHRAVMLGFPILAGLVAVVLSLVRPPSYRAEATLVLRPFDAAEQLVQSPNYAPIDFDRYLANERELVNSNTVAERVSAALGISPREALTAVEVASPPTSDIIRIIARAGNADDAVAIANGFADGYLEFRRATEVEVTQRKIKEIDAQTRTILGDITAVEEQLSATPNGPAAEALGQRRDSLVEVFTGLNRTARELGAESSLKRGSAELVERAAEGEDDSGIGPVSAGVGGVVLGLFVAAGYSLLYDRVSERVRSRRDLVDLGIQTTVIGELPRDRSARGEALRPAMLSRPQSRFAESMRALRASIDRLDPARPPVVLVASPNGGDGRSVIAINLAVAFAQTGLRTVLVSSDLRRTELESALALEGSGPGLAELARSTGVGEPQLLTTGLSNLAVLPAGAPVADPAETVGSSGVGEVLRALNRSGAAVILDSPPILDYADATLLARVATSILLVTPVGIEADDIRRSLSRLAREGVPVGLVLNGVDQE